MRLLILALVIPLSMTLAAQTTLVVGSKGFTESRILAEMIAVHVQNELPEITVEHRSNLGGTQIVYGALQAGEIDLYPEYTGTLWYVQNQRSDAPQTALQAFSETAASADKEQLRLLPPFGFNNTYGLLVNTKIAEELGLETISDLASKGGHLRMATSHEFGERLDGWQALKLRYGLSNSISFNEHELLYAAINNGSIDVMEVYTTDGKLLHIDGVVLRDDKNFFPPYHASPLVRLDTLQAIPGLAETLTELTWRINDDQMQCLNATADASGNYRQVAEQYLAGELCATALTQSIDVQQQVDDSFPFDELWRAFVEHTLLTLVVVLAALFIGVPLGITAHYVPRAEQAIFTVINAVQTIPALALFAVFVLTPGLGLGADTAAVAMLLYSLLPIVRNTFTGLQEIDENLIETGTGLGMSPWQLLTWVQIPLVLPFILAGIRTAAVLCVGLATIAAFVGAGGLGDFILTGLQLAKPEMIIGGALPAMALALALDQGLHRVYQRYTNRYFN